MRLHEAERINREFNGKEVDVEQAVAMNMKPSIELQERQGILYLRLPKKLITIPEFYLAPLFTESPISNKYLQIHMSCPNPSAPPLQPPQNTPQSVTAPKPLSLTFTFPHT
jgi:hypothetical protein